MLRSCTLVVLFCASSCLCLAHDAVVPTTIEHYPLDKVSDHIHVIHGPLTRPAQSNRGFMNNPSAILSRAGIIIVDPGSSREIGKQVVEKLRKITTKPVIAVINTHVHGDHWLGNEGVRELYPDIPIYAHERMSERANGGDGDLWVSIFSKMTKGATDVTKPVAPTIGLKGGETLKFDDINLRIYHTGHAHSDNDIMIEVVKDRSLFFGDIVVAGQVPNSDVPQDASFKGSINAIETMLRGPFTTFIPGHGRSGGKEVPETTLRFLHRLTDAVRKYYRAGLNEYEMKERIIPEMAEYRNWHNFDEMGRVINYVHHEIELEEFSCKIKEAIHETHQRLLLTHRSVQ